MGWGGGTASIQWNIDDDNDDDDDDDDDCDDDDDDDVKRDAQHNAL